MMELKESCSEEVTFMLRLKERVGIIQGKCGQKITPDCGKSMCEGSEVGRGLEMREDKDS